MPGNGQDPGCRVAPDARLQTPQVVDLAEELARYVLRENPERIRHTAGVADQAKLLTAAVSDQEAPLLVAVAWLHDIGYATALKRTGFHPVDGGLALREMGWPLQVCSLVAHHSGARYVAAVRQLDDRMAEFPYRDDALSDAVTTADQTAGPDGRPTTVEDRIENMLARHGPDSPNARADAQRRPYLMAAATRVADRLAHAGIGRDQHHIF